MIKYIKHITIFSIPLILFTLFLEVFNRNIEMSYNLKKEIFVSKLDNIKCAILGSSHGFYNINSNLLGKHSYNFANPSQSLYMDSEIFFQKLKNCKKLKTIILPISYFTLFKKESEENWRKYYYKSKMDIDFSILSNLSPKKHSIVLGTGYKSSIKTIINSIKKKTLNNVNCDLKGNGNYTSKRAADLSKAAMKTMKNHENFNFDISRNKEILERLCKYCTDNEINLKLVITPAHYSYRKLINQRKMTLILNVCKELDLKYDFVRFNNYFDFQLENEDFFDSDHLSSKGRDKFTLELKNSFIY